MSEILVYNLKDTIEFRQCHTYLGDLWQFLGTLCAKALSKLNIILKISANMTKVDNLTTLSKLSTCVFNKTSNFAKYCIPFRHLWWFFGGFWGAKILKSEQNFKNIRKFPKHNLTNTFVGNLIITLKDASKFRECYTHLRDLQ